MSIKWTHTKGDPREYMLQCDRGPAIPVYRQHPINTGARYKPNGPREVARRLQQRRNHV